jgi:hypothetical protein
MRMRDQCVRSRRGDRFHLQWNTRAPFRRALATASRLWFAPYQTTDLYFLRVADAALGAASVSL